jgi:hypothetical protein
VTVLGDVVPWLREQIAAVAADARGGRFSRPHSSQCGIAADVCPECDCEYWKDVLAQCDAHTALLEAYENAEARRARLTEAFTRNLRKIAELDPAEERRRYSEVSTANGVVSGYGMAVLLAASCYRHRAGYRAEWRP